MPKAKLNQTEYENAYNKATESYVPNLLSEIEDMLWARAHSANKFAAHSTFLLKMKETIVNYAREQTSVQDFSPKRNALVDTRVADEPFFLYFIKIAPELADTFTLYFNDNYNYLRNPEVIKYLAMPTVRGAKCATGNIARRTEIVNGKEPFPMRVPYYDKDGEIVDDFIEQELFVIREKLKLRTDVLTPVAHYFANQYLTKKIIKGKDINAATVLSLQNIIKDYPDILAMRYNMINRHSFASYLLNFPYRNPMDLLPAFANKNGMDSDGYPSSVDSKYTISPEEIMWYGIATKNKTFLKRFVPATANTFSTQPRINEHIDNIAKIAVNNPDYISDIVAPFLRKTTYATVKYPSKLLLAQHFQNVANETKDPAVAKEMARVVSQVVATKNFAKQQRNYDAAQTKIIDDFHSKRR